MTAYQQIASNKRRTVILLILFILVILVLGFIISYVLDYGYGGLILALIIAVVMSLFSYFSGDKVALFTAGAKGPLKKEDNSYIWNLVENLSITAGLEMPKIYLIPDPAMNAFATGRDPKHASIALTTGLIENLENQELEGVIAHELSHVKNYDIRLMMIVIVCVGIITLLTDLVLRGSFFGGDRRNNNLIFFILGLAAMIIAPLIAKLIQLSISRKREYLADASAVLLTRYPEGLASALEKISRNSKIKKPHQSTAHLYISSPVKSLFSTHPPVQDRINKLRSIA